MIIRTKYLGPTNYRPGRVKATMRTGRGDTLAATLGWDHSLRIYENHQAAMRAVLAKYDDQDPGQIRLTRWDPHWDEDGGYVFLTPVPGESFEA